MSNKYIGMLTGGGSIKGPILPEVSVSDEGKVLTVNSNGKWDAETPVPPAPIESNAVLVRYIYDGSNYTTETTYEDIMGYIDAGKVVNAIVISNSGTQTQGYNLSIANSSGIVFIGSYTSGHILAISILGHKSNDAIEGDEQYVTMSSSL